jgi:hypothetical protein
VEDFDFNPNKPKSPAIPQFYTEAVQNNFKSTQEGRPVFEDREFVRIIIPGDMRSQPVYEVNEEHKRRWPQQYDAFKRGLEDATQGTPITEWPPITKARATELKMRNIATVEALAEVGDNILGSLGMGAREMREKARVWLDVAKNGAAPIERLMSKVETLTASNESKDRTIAEMGARLEALERDRETAPKARRSRNDQPAA